MTALVFLIVYAGVLAFLAGCVARALTYARMPAHLRWEIYPVPHEEPERVAYGGSYFEQPRWWTKPLRSHWVTELRFMIPEMIFLKGLWDHNRSLWYRSFPFHFGLYLVAASMVCLVASVALTPAGVELSGTAGVLATAARILGAVGGAGVLVGALALAWRRLTAPEVRNYTAPGDVFNLIFFVVTFGLIGAGLLSRPEGAPGAWEVTRALLFFDTSIALPKLLAWGLVAGSLLVAYIPMTHMSHFIAKYFTYHKIRWDDVPMRQAQRLAKEIARYLSYRPRWAAPHVMADGRRSWAELAMLNPAQKGDQ